MAEPQDTHQAKASDPGVWVDRHGDALFRFAMVRLRNPELAEEVVQECLLAALKARDRFAGQSSERTWLIGILKRKCIDLMRKRSREPNVDDAAEEGGMPFDERGFWREVPQEWGANPGKLMESEEFWRAFEGCLGGLTEGLADAFLLRELDDVPSEEVCEVLGITPSNLWARLHRARLKLRECLERRWFMGGKHG